MNVAMLLEMVAEGAGERIVLGRRDSGLTAAELLDRSRRAAGWFTSLGVDHVSL
ncbi:MAG: hypothetical protein JO337_13060, partial [Acidimicrobiales bacterium]|nr:hypothetical protein [Acidimicrobiales bacterium]